MKKIFKIIGICFLTCFSFYYTDKIIDLSKNKDPIMIEIINYSKEHNIKAVSTVINDNYIETGTSGSSVDIDKSYEKMKKLGKFDESLIVYKEVMPENDIKDNYDKYIIKSNTNNYDVSLLMIINDYNYINEILDILENNNISTTFYIKNLQDLDTSYIEKIVSKGHNLGIIDSNVKQNLNIIKKYNTKGVYCYTNIENNNFIKECSRLKLNTILKENIDNNSYHIIKENLDKGVIFPISNTKTNINNLDIIIKYIKQKGYNIIDIDKLLTES